MSARGETLQLAAQPTRRLAMPPSVALALAMECRKAGTQSLKEPSERNPLPSTQTLPEKVLNQAAIILRCAHVMISGVRCMIGSSRIRVSVAGNVRDLAELAANDGPARTSKRLLRVRLRARSHFVFRVTSSVDLQGPARVREQPRRGSRSDDLVLLSAHVGLERVNVGVNGGSRVVLGSVVKHNDLHVCCYQSSLAEPVNGTIARTRPLEMMSVIVAPVKTALLYEFFGCV